MELKKADHRRSNRKQHCTLRELPRPDLSSLKVLWLGALPTNLRTRGILNECLHSVNKDCETLFFRLAKQYIRCEGVTGPLKAEDMMQWVEG